MLTVMLTVDERHCPSAEPGVEMPALGGVGGSLDVNAKGDFPGGLKVQRSAVQDVTLRTSQVSASMLTITAP
jgi:hypothetical protein